MKDLFDMTAGTSTGSIISAGLVYPDSPRKTYPKYFADDIIEIYSTRGGEIFLKHQNRYFALVIMIAVLVGGLGYLGKKTGEKIYANKKREAEFQKLMAQLSEDLRIEKIEKEAAMIRK